MKINFKTITTSAQHLSSVFSDKLPNGILHKGGTGVGGTTAAILSKESYIIAVPSVALCDCKADQHTNLFAYHFSESNRLIDVELQFTQYVINCRKNQLPIKVITTYNSFYKVVEQLEALGCNPTQIPLLVDEYDELLHSFSYRESAVLTLLSAAKHFTHKTFMSGTPIANLATDTGKVLFTKRVEGFFADVFQTEVDITNVVFDNTRTIHPFIVETDKPTAALLKILKQFRASGYSLEPTSYDNLGSTKVGELFIFVNSVTTILDICKQLTKEGFPTSDIRIVCAKTESNETKLSLLSDTDTPANCSYLIENLPTNSDGSGHRPITFITRKGFKGVDIYSNNGAAIILTLPNKDTTKIDLYSDLHQIVGRIRTESNVLRDHITLLMAKSVSKDQAKLSKEIAAACKAGNWTLVNELKDKLTKMRNKDRAMQQRQFSTDVSTKLENSERVINKYKQAKEELSQSSDEMNNELLQYDISYYESLCSNEEYYLTKLDGELVINKWRVLNEESAFLIRDSYFDGITVRDSLKSTTSPTLAKDYAVGVQIATTSLSFKNICKLFWDKDKDNKSTVQQLDADAYDILTKLTKTQVEKMGIVREACKNYIKFISDSFKRNVALQLITKLGLTKTTKFVSSKELKAVIVDIFTSEAAKCTSVGDTGLAEIITDEKVTASIVEEYSKWIDSRLTTKRIDNKVVQGYELNTI